MKRRRKRKPDTGAPKWMVTFSDMVTLILVFFILLFSMSQIDLDRFEAISQSFRDRAIFDYFPSAIPMENPTDSPQAGDQDGGSGDDDLDSFPQSDINDDEEEYEGSLRELMDEIEGFLDEQELNNVISANRTERGVVLVLQEKVLFDSGEADILDSGKPFLTKISALLTKIPNQVKVEGHTDNRPISNYRYPSNWELSGARAGSVIRYLISENDFDPYRFSVAGYGSTRPVVPNDTSANLSQNRRVEIVILELGSGEEDHKEEGIDDVGIDDIELDEENEED